MSRIHSLGVPLLAAMFVLTGCTSTYEVNVRNRADQPITAELRTGSPKGNSKTLVSTRIAPGDRSSLGPEKVGALKNVFLSVDFEGNTDLAETTKLKTGISAVNVHRDDNGSLGTVHLEVIRP